MLAWLPFAFGGVLPLSHMVLVGGTAILALLFGLRCVVGRAAVVGSWSLVPLLLFVALVAVQAMPGSGDLLQGVAPENHRLWTELAGAPALDAGLGAVSLSLNPTATRTDLRLLLALAALFALVANVMRDRGALRRLLTAVACIGALLAVIAVLQTLSGTDSLLWMWKAPGATTAGPFVHYGHFSQFTNLTIGCGIGLLLLRLAERDQRNQYVVEDLVRDLGAPDRRLDLFLFTFVVIAVVAICLSRSRNGVLSMLVAGAIVAAVLHRTKYLRGMGWSLGGLAALALIVLMMVGFDPVYDRMATLEDESLYDFRLAIARDALSAFGKFAWLGSGQGTFNDVFPLFDTTMRPGRAEHAENQYVELLVETGLVGASLAFAFLLAVVVPWLRRLKNHRVAGDAALFGLLFGVAAVLFHATSDFGLRIPAVATLTIVCLGVVAGQTGRVLDGVLARRVAAVVALLVAGGLAWQLPAIEAQRVAYTCADAAKDLRVRADKATTVADLLSVREQQRALLTTAILAVPERADLQVAYATAVWQWKATSEGVEFVPAKGQLSEEQAARLKQAAGLVQHGLLEARRWCPVRGDLWSLAGQFGSEWLDQPGAAAWVERGYRFAPENANTCLAWARQLLKQGDDKGAAAMFERAIRMGNRMQDVLGALVLGLERTDLALQVARANTRWLHWFVQKFGKDPAHQEVAAEARRDLLARLQQAVQEPTPEAWMLVGLAELEKEEGHDEAAIRHYRSYLSMAPTSGVRLSLALLLEKVGDPEAATAEAQRLLNYQPSNGGGKQLLQRLRLAMPKKKDAPEAPKAPKAPELPKATEAPKGK